MFKNLKGEFTKRTVWAKGRMSMTDLTVSRWDYEPDIKPFGEQWAIHSWFKGPKDYDGHKCNKYCKILN